MSDSPQEFRRKTEAMFALANRQIDEIARVYVSKVAWRLISTTPGPGLQLPDTEYQATGRLRAGWRWSVDRDYLATNWDEGPYTDYGEEVLAAIEAEVQTAQPLPSISYLWNNVAYGDIVHWGRGRHPWPRPWVSIVAQPTTLANLADEARQEVMGR